MRECDTSCARPVTAMSTMAALAVQSQGNLGQGSLLISTEVIVWMEEGVGGGSIVMVG